MTEQLKVGNGVLHKRIVRIVPKPSEGFDVPSFMGKVVDGLKGNQGFVDGDNLLDDPAYVGRSDPKVVYIVEE
ncbi:hypothetical protein KKB40_02500 [Patescibacteria group bacterium]|nr:hypothetical protein [Patescibacteria group bacterium]